MTSKQANVNYQERALSFRVGDRVTIPGSSSTQIGVVLHVWAAIGIVDVEWSHGARRMNVEDIIRVDDKGVGLPPDTNNLPVDIVPPLEKANPQKLATAFLKKSLFTNRTLVVGCDAQCPRCQGQCQKTAYQREDGQSVNLLACTSCLFVTKDTGVV